MNPRVVLVQPQSAVARRDRAVARDGWRIFRSADTGFELAIPRYQVARIEAIAMRESTEWYALAMGELLRDEGGVHAVVRDFVPNDWAERGRAHVRMGANAEAQVRELGRELHPALHPLGNLHTHPHFTTMPSGTDRQEFWSDPNSVSIIVDPFDRPTIAVYRGREGERLIEVAESPMPDPPKPAPPAALAPPCRLQFTQLGEGRLPAPRSPSSWAQRGTMLSMLACATLVVGSFAVSGYLFERHIAEVARSGEALRERVTALESEVAVIEATRDDGEPDGEGAPLECSSSEP